MSSWIMWMPAVGLDSGEMLPDVLPNVTENFAWANDNKTLFYGKQDETTLRQYQIYRHVVGTDPAQDQLVYQEDDETFVAYIFKTKSKKFLMIVASHTNSQEYRYLVADRPFGECISRKPTRSRSRAKAPT